MTMPLRPTTLACGLALLLALSLSAVAGEPRDPALKPADVMIPLDSRPRNRNGNCVWCAAETVFWGGAGLKAFEGARDRALKLGWQGSGMDHVIEYAARVNIPLTVTWNRDYNVLYQAVKAGSGAYVQVPGHALVLVGIDEHTVRLLDNNGPPVVQTWTRYRFDSTWQGTACFPRIFKRRLLCPRPTPSPVPLPLPINPALPVEPPLEPSSSTDLALRVTRLEKTVAGMARTHDCKDGRDGKDGKDAEINYPQLAESIAAKLKLSSPVIDYDQLASEVTKRLPPTPAYFEILPRRK